MPSDQIPRGPQKEMKPFRPKVFLYRMLGAIFVVEALFLGFAFYRCSERRPGEPIKLVDRCPKLGDRSETLFVAAITTTLSLLTGENSPRP